MSFRVLNSVLHSSLAISGRATVTAKARPMENNTKEHVIKIYWPERARPAEWNIISEAYEAAKNDVDIIDHLPRVVASHEFNEYDTMTVRDKFGLKPDDPAFPGNRVLRVVIFDF